MRAVVIVLGISIVGCGPNDRQNADASGHPPDAADLPDSGDPPFFERFYGGGIGSIRGFQFRGVSPRSGLADDAILSDEAFAGSGTTKADYRAAIVSIDALFALLEQGHGTNFERFSR